MSTERFKIVTSCFVINLLNSKTIILLNLAEYRLIFADSTYGLVGWVSDEIPRKWSRPTNDPCTANDPWGPFLESPGNFSGRKAIFRSSVSENGEVYTPETSCMKLYLYIF